MNLSQMLSDLKAKRPQVHCITNTVTAAACANILLACGASPIMAQDPAEVAEIAANSDALVLNAGTPSPERFTAITLAAKAANGADVPVILDPVGIGASAFRKKGISALLGTASVSVIRCNVSELCVLLQHGALSRGVDGAADLAPADLQALAKKAALWYHSVIAVTGETDVVCDGKRCCIISGGTEQLSRITGSGCMVSSLCGAFAGVETDAFSAAAAACAVMKTCAETASKTAAGTGSFYTALTDAVSTLSPNRLQEMANIADF